jgi:hypothetical protein
VAVYNEILEGGLNQALQKRLGMQTGAPAPSFAPELFGTVELPVVPEELMFWAGWTRWQAVQGQAAVAGEIARFQFRNPDASGVLMVVERVILHSEAQSDRFRGDFGYGPGQADLATLSGPFEFRDGRQRPAGGGAAIISAGTAALALTATAFLLATFLGGAGTGSNLEVPGGPWLLLPGNAMLLGGSTANTDGAANWVWRERRIVSGENNLSVG